MGRIAYHELERRLRDTEAELGALKREIAGHKQALCRSESKFITTYQHAPLLMTISSVEDGTYLDVNDAFVRITGYSREVAVGSTSVDIGFITAEDRKRLKDALTDEGRVEGMELRLSRADRSPLICLYHGELIETEDGVRLLSIATDITERSFAKRALEESEERFRQVIENLPGGVFVHDLDGRILLVNEKACENSGYTRDELLSMRILDIDPGSVGRNDRELLWRSLSPGECASIEAEHQRKDGSIYPTEVWITATRLDDQMVLLAESFDITERHRAALALRQSEREKSLILNTTAEMFAYYDLDLRIIWANRAAGDSVGLSPEALEGKHCYEIWNDEPVPCDECPVLEAKRTAKPVSAEKTTPDGRRWALRGYPVLDDDGAVIGLVELGRDITEWWRNEQARIENEAKTRAIVDNVSVGIAMISPDLRILELNRSMRRWFPEVDPESGPLCFRAIQHQPGDRPCDGCPTMLAIEDGKIHTHEITSTQIDGEHTYRVVASPLVSETGEVTAVVEMIEDITETLVYERRFHEAQRMEAVGQLTGGVAHDFNNLLQVITGETFFARELLPDDHPARSAIDSVAEAGERAAALVRQLLLFSRRQIMRPAMLDVNEVVAAVIAMLRRVIGEQIRVEWRPGDGVDPVFADRGMLEQLCMNLCINARDAMASGGTLTLATRVTEIDQGFFEAHDGTRPGWHVEIAVSDTGCGIDPETLEHIFEPFFTTKPMGKGSGLGLSTVYGIVKQHDGMIHIESEPGTGTSIRVYLPVAEPVASVGPE